MLEYVIYMYIAYLNVWLTCSILKTNWLKKNCRVSFAKLIHNCSKLFFSKSFKHGKKMLKTIKGKLKYQQIDLMNKRLKLWKSNHYSKVIIHDNIKFITLLFMNSNRYGKKHKQLLYCAVGRRRWWPRSCSMNKSFQYQG